ncbi:unnamed protein product [Prorocentrum cordatum]|uniref:FACT complex subunit n=1 Tax=Prorocentrum cordatum TaxID=2364126 RepID=A0ABN9TW46_9DINO|nr:unnamed protein product [Polarella glacialis]
MKKYVHLGSRMARERMAEVHLVEVANRDEASWCECWSKVLNNAQVLFDGVAAARKTDDCWRLLEKQWFAEYMKIDAPDSDAMAAMTKKEQVVKELVARRMTPEKAKENGLMDAWNTTKTTMFETLLSGEQETAGEKGAAGGTAASLGGNGFKHSLVLFGEPSNAASWENQVVASAVQACILRAFLDDGCDFKDRGVATLAFKAPKNAPLGLVDKDINRAYCTSGNVIEGEDKLQLHFVGRVSAGTSGHAIGLKQYVDAGSAMDAGGRFLISPLPSMTSMAAATGKHHVPAPAWMVSGLGPPEVEAETESGERPRKRAKLGADDEGAEGPDPAEPALPTMYPETIKANVPENVVGMPGATVDVVMLSVDVAQAQRQWDHVAGGFHLTRYLFEWELADAKRQVERNREKEKAKLAMATPEGMLKKMARHLLE